MGKAFSKIPIIGPFFGALFGDFDQPAPTPCRIDPSAVAQMESQRAEIESQRNANNLELERQRNENNLELERQRNAIIQEQQNFAIAQAKAQAEQVRQFEQHQSELDEKKRTLAEEDAAKRAQMEIELERQKNAIHQEQQNFLLAQEKAKAAQEREFEKSQRKLEEKKRALLAEEAAKVAQLKKQQKDLDEAAKSISKRDQETKLVQATINAEREERHKARDEGTLVWLCQLAIEKLSLDCVNDYNVGITGQSGTGKSSIINAIRGLSSSDQGAAEVDEDECTTVMTKYPLNENSHLMLWDCPGAGTFKHPLASYFYDKFLFAFDYLLFVFTERFREAEIDLMKQAIAHRVPFALVRNKINHDFNSRSERDAEFRALTQEEAVAKLIEEKHIKIKQHLREAGITSFVPEIFVINAWSLTNSKEIKFEESRLADYVARAVIEGRRRRK